MSMHSVRLLTTLPPPLPPTPRTGLTSMSFSSTRYMSNDPTVTSSSLCCATPPLLPLPLPLRSAATTCTKSASLRMWMWSCSTHHCPVGWSPPPPYRHSPQQLRTIHIHVRPPAVLSCELIFAHTYTCSQWMLLLALHVTVTFFFHFVA